MVASLPEDTGSHFCLLERRPGGRKKSDESKTGPRDKWDMRSELGNNIWNSASISTESSWTLQILNQCSLSYFLRQFDFVFLLFKDEIAITNKTLVSGPCTTQIWNIKVIPYSSLFSIPHIQDRHVLLRDKCLLINVRPSLSCFPIFCAHLLPLTMSHTHVPGRMTSPPHSPFSTAPLPSFFLALYTIQSLKRASFQNRSWTLSVLC